MGRASRRKQFREKSNRASQVKLSERLIEIIAPFRQSGMDQSEYEALLKLGSTAWNLSRFSPEERAKTVDRALRAAGVQMDFGTRAALEEMVERKTALFPEDLRFIAGVHVTDLGGGRLHVTVASVHDE